MALPVTRTPISGYLKVSILFYSNTLDHYNHLLTSFQPLREFDIIDAENLELYLMGDLNCNLLSEVVSNNPSHLLNIIDIYGLTQLITGPTRVTQYSSTLIDLGHTIPQIKSHQSHHHQSQKVIKLLIKAIEVGKANGLEKISNRILKIAADVVAPSLTGIFNQSLVTGIFPSDWKLAKVSPIFKNGSKSDLNNYRPISVIPAVAKIFEKIIYDQLYQYPNENGLLNSGQSGVRSLHSTLIALLETNDSWCVNIDRGLFNGVIFTDLTTR